jgi:hypothetical protein
VNAPVKPGELKLDAVEVFIARAEAKAQLWFNGALSLHDAVDEAWASAVEAGIVRKLGVDATQKILSDIFAPLRDDLPWSHAATAELEPDDDVVPDLISEDESADDDYAGLPSSFVKACREADERARQQRALERELNERPGAAKATINALMFALRKGPDALKHPDNRRRLNELNDAQIREVATRVQKFMPHITPAWTPEQVEALISIWRKLR